MSITGGLASFAGEREEVEELIVKLGQRDWQDAVDALVKIGESAVEPLICTLQARNVKTWIIHIRVVDVLAKICSKQAIDAIVKSVEDAGLNPCVRAAAARSLGQIKAENAADSLIDVFKDESWIVRLNAREDSLQIGANEQLIAAFHGRLGEVLLRSSYCVLRYESMNAELKTKSDFLVSP